MRITARPSTLSQLGEPFVVDDAFRDGFQSAFVRLNRQRRKARQFVGPFKGFGKTTDAVNSSLADQLFRVVHTDTQQHVSGNRPAEFVTGALDRPLVDCKAEAGGGYPEPARRRRNAKITRERQLRSGTHGRTVDCGKCDAGQSCESTQCRAERRTELVAFDAGQVGPGTERRRFTRENDHARTRCDCRLMSGHHEEALEVDRIASVRSSDRDHGNVLAVPVKRDRAFARASRFVACDLYHLLDNMTSGSPSPSSSSSRPNDQPNDRPNDNAAFDPVRARRQQVAKWSLLANRVGYLLYALTITCFVLAFAIGFNAAMVTMMTAGLVGGSVLLAPSIVLGYAVKAAEREDVENNR